MAQELRAAQRSDLQVHDETWIHAAALELDYLLSFNPDRLLVEFRVQSGLEAHGLKNYGGWERGYSARTNPDGTDQPSRFTGHFVGHYLSAISQALTGPFARADQRRKLASIQRQLVVGLRQAQEAYASQDPANAGFLPAFRVDALPGGKDGLIVPFYNLHKLVQGLIDAHDCAAACGEDDLAQTALAAAGDFADFVVRWQQAHADVDMLAIEYGGMNEALYRLYALTGNPNHLKAAQLFDEDTLFRQLAAGGDCLPGLHANATIPKVIGALTRYALLGRRSQDDCYFQAARNFWDMVVAQHTYATGSNSQAEHFHQPGELWQDATTNGNADGGYNNNSTCETCNAHNMLKLTRLLLELTGEVKYADFYEWTFTNAILASQDPCTGMTTYFQPMQAGYPKVFGTPYGEFWCCQGTGIENFAKLGDSAYFTDKSGVYANQFVSSDLADEAHGLRIHQEAHLPQNPEVTFTVEALDGDTESAQAGEKRQALLRLRLPDWAQASAARLLVNGKKLAIEPNQQGWLELPVGPGTNIAYRLPPRLRALPAPDNPNWVAFAYGPALLAGVLSPTDSASNYSYGGILVRVGKYDARAARRARIQLPQGMSAQDWLEDLPRWIQPVNPTDPSLPFAFELETTPSAVSAQSEASPASLGSQSGHEPGARKARKMLLLPYSKLHRSVYAVYLDLVEPANTGLAAAQGAAGQDAAAHCDMRILDSVTPDQGNNIERAKKLKASANSRSLIAGGRTFRDAGPAGWFSYELTVDSKPGTYYLSLLTSSALAEQVPGQAAAFSLVADPCPELESQHDSDASADQLSFSAQACTLATFAAQPQTEQPSDLVWYPVEMPQGLLEAAQKGRIRFTFKSEGGKVAQIYGLRVYCSALK
ncbi:hypothetical protein KIM372_17450 [Bombiscardovia nodaiensis]|uniref:Acetyl-CoA carboxylase n=1 Tax=Bombiscardovia nodaiensis TaxID=2932181 RepID=A0ABM8BAB0_9BIFI|nr:hypothetical protein KIM372_17450 [Bombiscardovia nodaiensis]